VLANIAYWYLAILQESKRENFGLNVDDTAELRLCSEQPEYSQLVRTAVAALCRKRPSPLLRGSEEFWAAGFIHAIGTANFVFDKSQTRHCNAPDIYSFFGVASSTGQGKSKQIRQ
jgi:hypothetical protein